MFLRHPNGNGKIYGDNAEVCPQTTLKKSDVFGECLIWQSIIQNSQVENSDIYNAHIVNSQIIGSLITGGFISDSFINCELVTGNAQIFNSKLYGLCRIGNSAIIHDSKISNLTVRGNAEVNFSNNSSDFESFDGQRGYVSRGTWTRPPKVKRFDFGITVTESVDDFAFVGCREMKISTWLKGRHRFGKACGWDIHQIDAVAEFLSSLQ
jgi:hypothetical protein